MDDLNNEYQEDKMEDVYSSRPTRIRLMEIFLLMFFRSECLKTITLKKIQLPYDHDQECPLKECL
jgi:hypothetical protein